MSPLDPSPRSNIVYRRIERLPAATLASFADVDVAAVHESMDMATLMNPSIVSVVTGKRIWGQAVTALNSPGDILAMLTALRTAQAGDVLVVSSGPDSLNAVWGELATTAAMTVGVAALVTDGAVRDTQFIRKAGFPVWARALHALRSTRAGEVAVNVPLWCGGVEVNPGDVVVADDDGVVVVPWQEAGTVARMAADRKRAEAARKPYVRSAKSPYEPSSLDQALNDLGTVVHDAAWTDEP